jgi:hypothetical protein
MGTGKNGNCIYVTDLSLAAKYRLNRAPQNAPSNPRLLGTAVFASVNSYFKVGRWL